MRGSVKTDEEEEETEGGSLGEMADDVGKKPVMTDKIISAGFGSNRKKKRRIGASTASHRVAVWCGCGGPGAAPVLI